MAACAPNARPLGASKGSISDPLRECFRGVPRREFESGGGEILRTHRTREELQKCPNSGTGGGPKLENACPGLPFGDFINPLGPKDASPRDASFGTQTNLHMQIFR